MCIRIEAKQSHIGPICSKSILMKFTALDISPLDLGLYCPHTLIVPN